MTASEVSLTDLKPGDIVTAYQKGVHEVVRIERRFLDESNLKFKSNKGKKAGDEWSPLIHYRRRLNSNGAKANQRELVCCASFCEKVTAETIASTYKKTVGKASKLRAAMTELIESAGQ